MEVELERPGLLIVLEGIDGVGKTTQIDLLAALLRRRGLGVVTGREPTDGPHGQRLRQSMREQRLEPAEELALFIADRREHVQNVIQPALSAGDVVLLDRYYYSTAAYQGARGGDPWALIAQNESFAPRPNLVVLLDADPSESLGRIAGGHDTFEVPEALRASRAIFLELAGALSHFAVVRAHQTPRQVSVEIRDAVRSLVFERFGLTL